MLVFFLIFYFRTMSLTKRQRIILNAIINEFLDSASAVGSVTLYDKYDIGVSPATLRSEMAKLVDEGYLLKEHTSSGRVPTTLGIRYFIDELFKEEEIDPIEETKAKENLFRSRFSRARFIREAVKTLSELSGQASVSLVDDMVFASGLSYLLMNPEYEDYNLLQDTLNIMESDNMLNELFGKYHGNRNLRALVGDEIGLDALSDCSIVYCPYKYFRGTKGYIGVIGPKRMPYSRVIPAVRVVSEFIEDAIVGWD